MARYSGDPEVHSAEARQNVLRILAERHDFFANAEQLFRGKGEDSAAEGAHTCALWVLRAYRNELDDPGVGRSV